jgi:hypothetical protein
MGAIVPMGVAPWITSIAILHTKYCPGIRDVQTA